MKNLLLAVVSVAAALLTCELLLRYQPFVALRYAPETLQPELRISYTTHHKTLLHADVQTAHWGPRCGEGTPELTVLFLGDSWMESMDGIPKGFADAALARTGGLGCLTAVNGAVFSYAPSLMLLKGERLLAERHFDLVVVNVDETDLMDESLRYARTTLRGPAGQIERVVPNVVDLATLYQHPTLQHQSIYILRLLEQLYYERVLLPRLRNEFYGSASPIGEYSRILAPQLSSDPRRTHADEIRYFHSVVGEMLGRFARSVGPASVVLTHHPHFLHLRSLGGDVHYNTILSEILRSEAASAGVQYYDAHGDIEKLSPDIARRLFQWPEDPFSHLTPAGYRHFGRLIENHRQAVSNLSDVSHNRAAASLSLARPPSTTGLQATKKWPRTDSNSAAVVK